MFLAIDIGNTNITLGLFKFNGNKLSNKPFQIWRIATSKKKTADEYAIKILDIFYYSNINLKKQKIKNIAIASVVPSLDTVFDELTKRYFNIKAFFISSNKLGDTENAIKYVNKAIDFDKTNIKYKKLAKEILSNKKEQNN